MPSNDAIYLYSLISHEMSNYLVENMQDVHSLPLEDKKKLHDYVKQLCSISRTFHTNTEISVEVLNPDNIIITFECSFHNILKKAKVFLSNIEKPYLELSLHRNSIVYKSSQPLICSRIFQIQFDEFMLKQFSVIFDSFRSTRSKTIYMDLKKYLQKPKGVYSV